MPTSHDPTNDVAPRLQPTRPGGAQEWEAGLEQGRWLRLDGQPLARRTCSSCGGLTVGETCPQSLPCPSCDAEPGQRCRRPSQHEADRWHQARVRAAAAADDAREHAGDPSVPARWPG